MKTTLTQLAVLFLFLTTLCNGQDNWDTLLIDGFDNGSLENWDIGSEWAINQNDENYFLTGKNHSWANCNQGNFWTDYSLKLSLRIKAGTVHVNVRIGQTTFWRYMIGISSEGFYLEKQIGDEFTHLDSKDITIDEDIWHSMEVVVYGKTIQVYLNDILQIQYYDESAITGGNIAFETLESADIDFDSILVVGENTSTPLEGYEWFRTGGPIGGLGYDIRIHPENQNIMFVTDNPSGVNKSIDGGKTWKQKNSGISVYSGTDSEAVPIFSLTIDPNNPDIVWSGTQDSKGIYRSDDGGESWQKKDNGVTEGDEISFRGFAIHPENSSIVLAAAEINTPEVGIEFSKTKGKIYKTINGGDNWYSVWEGDNLARVLIYNYLHPDTLFCSTGIFDREAYNSDIAGGILGGVGILRSYDGGESWHTANEGIDNLYLGFLEMHPSDPDILFAAASNNSTSYPPNHSFGGIYKTMDGGDNWNKIISYDEGYGAVTISKSNTDIVYAIGASVYRSSDGGDSWSRPTATANWGPPGISPGFVISAVVDPEDPDKVWVNNYGGGNFVSSNGGKSWSNSSNGYTGARIRDIMSIPSNPNSCYLASRGGPFVTYNGGNDWIGVNYQNALNESYSIEVFPDNSKEILAARADDGAILKSKDGGSTWEEVFRHPDVNASSPGSRHNFRDFTISKSHNNIVYAGMGKVINVGMIDPSPEQSFGMYKSIDRGENWTEINIGLESSTKTINIIAVHPEDPDIVYIGTYIDGIYKTTDGGAHWTPVNNGLQFSDIRSIAIDPLHPDTIYAGSGNGMGLAISYNGGALWGSINEGIKLVCPTYLSSFGKAAQGMDLSVPTTINPAVNYNVQWTKILDIVIDPANTQNIYAADEGSGVVLSQDHGKTWSLITEGMGIRTITCLSISPAGDVLYCGSEGEGVYRLVLDNQAPNVYSKIPISDTISIYKGDSTMLELLCADLNNDTLAYSWYLNGNIIENHKGSTLKFHSDPYDPGYYDIKASLSDNDTITETSWTIHIISLPSNYPTHEIDDLLKVYPNPFNSSLSVDYYLERNAHVHMSVIDLQSRVIGILLNQMQPAGNHTLSWHFEGPNSYGNPGGIYILKIVIEYDNLTVTQERKIAKINQP
jgi:photosystem II stability/assembly factor-like uncharacterized protein